MRSEMGEEDGTRRRKKWRMVMLGRESAEVNLRRTEVERTA
jgi:hypothetical protein